MKAEALQIREELSRKETELRLVTTERDLQNEKIADLKERNAELREDLKRAQDDIRENTKIERALREQIAELQKKLTAPEEIKENKEA